MIAALTRVGVLPDERLVLFGPQRRHGAGHPTFAAWLRDAGR